MFINTFTLKNFYLSLSPTKPNSTQEIGSLGSLVTPEIEAVESNTSGMDWTTRTTDPCLSAPERSRDPPWTGEHEMSLPDLAKVTVGFQVPIPAVDHSFGLITFAWS